MNDKLRDALEAGWKMAAQWANREDLIADIGSPAFELDVEANLKALAASKQEPQAQAEPEVVAWANSASLASASISRQRGGPFDQHTLGESKNSFHDTPLITLQSHREAIAKKDAALKACVEAHTKLRSAFAAFQTAQKAGDVIEIGKALADISDAEVAIQSAITQVKEARK